MSYRLKYILIVISILSLSLVLPWLFSVVCQPVPDPVLLSYSAAKDVFIINHKSGSKTKFLTQEGENLSKDEYYESLPVFYYRKLEKEGRLPDSINGEPLTINNLKKHNYFFRLNKGDIKAPQPIELPMFESTNEPAHFEFNKDFFRFKNDIEFYDVFTKEIMHAKSDLFTKALMKAGFVFPTKKIYGDIRPQKNYDNGYYLVDANQHLFKLKMLNQKPSVEIVRLPIGLKVKHILCTDPINMEIMALIIGSDNSLYLHLGTTNTIIKTDVTNYNPLTDNLLFFGNQFNKTLIIQNERMVSGYAINDDYITYKKYKLLREAEHFKNYDLAQSLIFPFVINIHIKKNQVIIPHFSISNTLGILGTNVLLGIIFFLLYRSRKSGFVIILFTGIYGFITLIFIK